MGFAKRRPDWELPELQLDLQLHPFDDLDAAARQPCPRCQRSRHLFCYDCLVALTPTPSVQLPFTLSIITHHAESASKNTGMHAALLCPGQVQLHSIEQLPALQASQCAVMFPSEDALLPEQLDLQRTRRVIVIDSKWAKARELNQHPALQGMPRVKLPGSPRSCFWRFHTEGVADEGVSTIEALYLLLQPLAVRLGQPAHAYDNLLWYFAHQHQRVAQAAAQRAAARQQKMEAGLLQPRPAHLQQKKRKKGHGGGSGGGGGGGTGGGTGSSGGSQQQHAEARPAPSSPATAAAAAAVHSF